MFILTKIADLVQIVPEDFNKDAPQAIEDNINAKYANKVIQKIGLCICLYDLLSSSEGLIGRGTGLVNVNVEFRLIVFRPFKHEVIIGRISSANTEGIRVRLPFFEEIFIPRHALPEGSDFSPEQVYEWRTEDNTLFFDNHEPVRLRIEDEVWKDQNPIGPREKEEPNSLTIPSGSGKKKNSPYSLIGSMEDAGLGVIQWWDGDDGEDEEEGLEEGGE
ncbi:related to RPC25-DNA-direcred RNA polymerase III, 25 KD subunit [Rhynchosporium secalis]|uniref:DNA-directed RNA polymerase subunit n=1 Tax=Rhynchosporium secalis TaxID=38038 RepID=A0A1E1M957_RHYSE|nr:related to RPC25-DNA-direcred RNA polymerase III, 25 KD subunit [Rhynchosporium secalis]